MSDFEPSPAFPRRYIESDRVEGTAVYDARGHHVGEVKRLIIEKLSGQVAFVVIAFQSFFGLGEDNHALAWNKLHYDQELEGYRTDVTEEELRGGFQNWRARRLATRKMHALCRSDWMMKPSRS